MPIREPYPKGHECPECGDCHLVTRDFLFRQNGLVKCKSCGWCGLRASDDRLGSGNVELI